VGGRDGASEQSEEVMTRSNVIFVVGRKVNMLSKDKGGEKRQKLRGEVISRIIKMYVKNLYLVYRLRFTEIYFS